MDGSGIGESAGAKVTTQFPFDAGPHCRTTGDRALFPKWAYQPGLFHGDAASPTLSLQRLDSAAVLLSRLAGRPHTHVRWSALPTRCVGRSHPGQRLGAAWINIRWVRAERDRVKKYF